MAEPEIIDRRCKYHFLYSTDPDRSVTSASARALEELLLEQRKLVSPTMSLKDEPDVSLQSLALLTTVVPLGPNLEIRDPEKRDDN